MSMSFLDHLTPRGRDGLDHWMEVELGVKRPAQARPAATSDAPAPAEGGAEPRRTSSTSGTPNAKERSADRLSPGTLVALGQLARGELTQYRVPRADVRPLGRAVPEARCLLELAPAAHGRVHLLRRGDELRVTLDGATELARFRPAR